MYHGGSSGDLDVLCFRSHGQLCIDRHHLVDRQCYAGLIIDFEPCLINLHGVVSGRQLRHGIRARIGGFLGSDGVRIHVANCHRGSCHYGAAGIGDRSCNGPSDALAQTGLWCHKDQEYCRE